MCLRYIKSWRCYKWFRLLSWNCILKIYKETLPEILFIITDWMRMLKHPNWNSLTIPFTGPNFDTTFLCFSGEIAERNFNKQWCWHTILPWERDDLDRHLRVWWIFLNIVGAPKCELSFINIQQQKHKLWISMHKV